MFQTFHYLYHIDMLNVNKLYFITHSLSKDTTTRTKVMLYLMDLTLTTNITSRDSLIGAPPDTNRFPILKQNKEFLTRTCQSPYQYFWPRNTNRVLTAFLPVFFILGNSSPGPTRIQLEIRKDREIFTRVEALVKILK